MARNSNMRLLAKWHIWLGWLVGVPIVMWLASGLFMTIKPIQEVRGEHLRLPVTEAPLVIEGSELATEAASLKDMRLVMQEGRAVALLTTTDGITTRVDYATGEAIAPVTAEKAREIVANRIVGGDQVTSVRFFEADEVPFDFRRSLPVWQVTLDDATHIYIGRDTSEVEAVRTQWWRWFDFMWGLHIMDLSEREATSHPILILFAGLSLSGAAIGCTLMFRRRKGRVKTPTQKATIK